MGLEIGWYLRFSRDEVIVALVDKGTEGQLENALTIIPDWTLNLNEENGHLRATFNRKKS